MIYMQFSINEYAVAERTPIPLMTTAVNIRVHSRQR
jgi:hypothetical protein